MNQKSLILILAAIGIVTASLVAGIIFLNKSKTTNPTMTQAPQPSVNPQLPDQTAYPSSVGTDWETYTNSKYGYSLKYPPNWATIINVTPGSRQETLTTATSLDIFDSAAKKSYPDGVMTIQYLNTAPSLPNNWNKTDVTLGGKNGQKFEGDDKNLHIETYILPASSGVLEIDARYPAGDTIKSTFDAMLSSLQMAK